MKEIYLNNLELKIFTEQDIKDYCGINNINPDNITVLNLSVNELTDISGVKLFKNLKELWLDNNKIKNISVIKNLKNLKSLYIQNLKLESDQIKYINSLKNLKELRCYKGFKDMSVINKLNRNIKLYG